jgi:hypothetical protein
MKELRIRLLNATIWGYDEGYKIPIICIGASSYRLGEGLHEAELRKDDKDTSATSQPGDRVQVLARLTRGVYKGTIREYAFNGSDWQLRAKLEI